MVVSWGAARPGKLAPRPGGPASRTGDVTAMAQLSFKYLDCRADQGVLVLTLNRPDLRGEELTDAVREELAAALNASGRSQVVLNLENVEFLTSMGIRALMLFRRHVRDRGGRLLLCGLSPLVADTLITPRL